MSGRNEKNPHPTLFKLPRVARKMANQQTGVSAGDRVFKEDCRGLSIQRRVRSFARPGREGGLSPF